jgi:hypothetical protein
VTEEILKAKQEYDAAFSVIQRTASSGCPGNAGRGHEARLGHAYHRLVQLGVAPRLKGKYRG